MLNLKKINGVWVLSHRHRKIYAGTLKEVFTHIKIMGLFAQWRFKNEVFEITERHDKKNV